MFSTLIFFPFQNWREVVALYEIQNVVSPVLWGSLLQYYSPVNDRLNYFGWEDIYLA